MPIQKPNIKLDEEYIQLALGLDLPEVELDGVSVEEARRRSEAGRSAFMMLKGTGEQPEWFKRFEFLTNKGLPWRQACYVAWASTPKEGRKPETQEELATKYLNLTSDRAISTWKRKNGSLDTMIAVMQSFELWEYRGDWFANLIRGMQKAGDDYKFFNHLKLFGEVTGDYVPLAQLAAVLKRKADSGAHDVDEDVLDELAEEARELEGMLSAVSGQQLAISPASGIFDGQQSGEGEEVEAEELASETHVSEVADAGLKPAQLKDEDDA